MISSINCIPKNDQIILRLSVTPFSEIPQLSAWITSYDNTIQTSEGYTMVEVSLLATQARLFLQHLSSNKFIAAEQLPLFMSKLEAALTYSASSSYSSSSSSFRSNPSPLKTPDQTALELFKNKLNEFKDAIRLHNNAKALQMASMSPTLLKEETYYSAPDHFGYDGYINALEYAAIHNNKILVEHWVTALPVNKKMIKSKKYGINEEVLQLLITANYKTRGPRPYGENILHAITFGDGSSNAIQLIKDWIRYDPNCLKDPKTFETALQNANADILKLLMDKKTVFDIDNVLIRLPYGYRYTLGKLNLLISSGAGLDADNNAKVLKHVLSCYAFSRHDLKKKTILESIQILVTLPIDWPLHQESIMISAIKYSQELMPLLYGYIDKNSLCQSPKILLVLAENFKFFSHEELTELLLSHLTTDNNQNAMIFDTILKSFPENDKQKWLLDYLMEFADINWNYLNNAGNTFLHTAVLVNPLYIPIFCQKGLNINTLNRDGATALHTLAISPLATSSVAIAKLLFAQGINPLIRCDINHKDKKPILNATALQLAHSYHKKSLAELIKEYCQGYEQTYEHLPTDTVAFQEEEVFFRRFRDKIADDIDSVKDSIYDIRNAPYMIRGDGLPLRGDNLALLKKDMIHHKKQILHQLKGLFASQIIPECYYSPLDGKKHSRIPEEKPSLRLLGNAKYYNFCIKKSRKASDNPHSLFSLYHDDKQLISEFTTESRADKKYPRGGFSQRVKKGFVANDDNPKYAIKIFKTNLFNRTNADTLRLAMRGAFCSRLLGRTGLVFRRKNKQYLVTDWHDGSSLAFMVPQSLLQIPLEKRIKFALDLTRQLVTIHSHGIILGDIKPDNVMISLDSIHLIDLDSAILKGEPPFFTPKFLDAKLNYFVKKTPCFAKFFDKKSDIYAFGLTLTYLFPELFIPNIINHSVTIVGSDELFQYSKIELKKGNSYHNHKELCKLIIWLIAENKEHRPDSAEEFFTKLTILASNHYRQDFQWENIEGLAPPSDGDDNKLSFTKKTFREIDGEIYEYNDRNHRFKT